MTKAAIIDANAFGHKTMRPEVADAIIDGLKVIMSKGGKLDQELKDACLEKYAELSRSDRLHIVCSRSVEKKQKNINNKATLESNDDHIIALAIVACANTLVTDDSNLICDFKDVCRINREAGCIEDNRLKGRKRIIGKESPRPKDVVKIIRTAKAKGHCCECIANGGGC